MAEQLKPVPAGGEVPLEKLKAYKQRLENLDEQLQGLRGDKSSVLSEAEGAGIHKAAFKQVVKLANMTPEKRADFLRAFDDYRHKLGIDDQLDMLDAAE